MSDIEAMRESIHDLYSLVAQERLRNDANAQEPSAKLGIFVDPFFDDDNKQRKKIFIQLGIYNMHRQNLSR